MRTLSLSLALALSGLLAATTLPALAQTTPAETPAPAAGLARVSVGLSAYSSFYQATGTGTYSGIRQLPVQLTAAYQLRPRLAVQLGVAYSGYTANYVQNSLSYSPPQSPSAPQIVVEGRYTLRTTSATALARYTLTANPAHRLQFDALGGFTLVHRHTASRGTETTYTPGTPGTVDTRNIDFRNRTNTVLLTAGLGTSYRLSRRFDLTYDFLVNKALNPEPNSLSSTPANTLTTSHALGLRLRLGR